MMREVNKFADLVKDYVTKRSPHIAEVGVFMAKDCILDSFIKEGIQCTLVEPQPKCIEDLKSTYAEHSNVTIHPVAIGYEVGQDYLYIPEAKRGNPDAGASAYIDRDGSPQQARTGQDVDDTHSVRVEVLTFDMIDDGSIDAIHIDTEGFEWAVIKNMVSRPTVLSVEMYGPRDYVNPHKDEIQQWLAENKYILHTVCQVEYPRPTIWVDTDEIYIKER
jgi:FkbM family methyltransferase